MLDQALLEEITRRLAKEFAPERIYLFGSHAWGQADSDSDLDFMVIVAPTRESRYELTVRAHRALADLPVAKDVLVETSDEFSFRAQAPSSLERKICQEGRLLYGCR